MRKTLLVFCILAAIGFGLSACTKNRIQRIETRPAMVEFGAGIKDYIKKVAIVSGKGTDYDLSPQLNEDYFSAMVQALGKQSSKFTLFRHGDEGVPAFDDQWSVANQSANLSVTAGLARIKGFNALLNTALADIRVHSKKTGFWFWSGTKYIMTVTVTLDILDPFTAAKSTSIVEEQKVECDQATYEAVKSGQWDAATGVDGTLQQLAQTMAQKAAAELQQLRWQTAVIQVEGNRVALAAGKSDGLAIGDRLAVFEGRQVISGDQGQHYIAPGYKVGEIQISDLDRDRAEAMILGGAGIGVGDIAVAVSK